MEKNSTLRSVLKISIPVALQCMLQASFSIVDQIMIGRLGSVSIAAVGLASKFSGIYFVVAGAVAAVAGIMISQYIGSDDKREVSRSFSLNMLVSFVVAVIFTAASLMFSRQIMSVYSTDSETVEVAAYYLRIIALVFVPLAGNMLLSTMLRCLDKASLPLYFSIIAAVMNTALNYVLIFGRFGFPKLGVGGAAIATAVSQCVNFALLIVGYIVATRKNGVSFSLSVKLGKMTAREYIVMLMPILITEFMWSLGENVYASVYGHLGTPNCAAMTLSNPIQGLMIGALSGLSQAAGILIGKELGKRDHDSAYLLSRKMMKYGLIGSLVLSVVLIAARGLYVQIFDVEPYVRDVAQQILIVFAVVSPIKVLNMIMSGGILRSGGKTSICLVIDTIGTWGFGVPLALISAFVFNLPIAWVYFILSLEEAVRLTISLVVFRKRIWIKSF